MTDPIAFDSTTTRFQFPLLYTGQAHKEAFVNEALSRADMILHCAVEGESASPPEKPTEGQAWIVAGGAIEAWAARDGAVACRTGGSWTFVAPRDGMRVFDRSSGRDRLFFGSWRKASVIAEPVGGLTVDGEARAAIIDLMASLRAVGILPSA